MELIVLDDVELDYTHRFFTILGVLAPRRHVEIRVLPHLMAVHALRSPIRARAHGPIIENLIKSMDRRAMKSSDPPAWWNTPTLVYEITPG